MRCGLRMVVTLSCVVLAHACSSDDPDAPGAAADSAPTTTAARVTVSSPNATSGSGPATTTTVPLDVPTLTRTCEEYVPLAAFTGDIEMQALWTSVSQDAGVLAIWCSEIAINEPGRLAPMVDALVRIREGLEPGTTVATVTASDTPPTVATDTSAPATPSPVDATGAVRPGERGVMPDLVCMLLRNAKDALAAVGLFSVTALDLSGDAGDTDSGTWIVVTQSPFRGGEVGDAEVRLGVLRPGEPTAC